MLLKCPECELQVSDKAITCPHCGYPLQPNIIARQRRKSNRRKRLPNGFGQITELKGRNLRKPFRAMVTVGKDEKGKPISKLLTPEAYFSTYNEAYEALLEYNKDPYAANAGMKLSELYDKWSSEYLLTLKESSRKFAGTAWKYCSAVHDMEVQNIRARHIKDCMENGTIVHRGKVKKPTAHVKGNIKSLFNLMLDYALEYEIVEKNYARTFTLSEDIKEEKNNAQQPHIPFTDEEMKILWDNVDKKTYVDVLLIQCYSGWRPQELGLIELKDVDLENWTFIGGMKTDAGENRMVPIHPIIRPLVERKYKEAVSLDSEYLFNRMERPGNKKKMKFTYYAYWAYFENIIEELKLNPQHRPHDARKHFVTMAKKHSVDEYAIKYIVGHKIDDITEKVYTDREFSWLETEIQKIK